MSNDRSCLLYIQAYVGGSALGHLMPLRPILPQNQFPVVGHSLVLDQRPFLDHEGLSLRAAILPQLLYLRGQEVTSSWSWRTLLLTWPC